MAAPKAGATGSDAVPLRSALTDEQEELWLRTYSVNRFRILTWYSTIMQLVVAIVMFIVGIIFIIAVSNRREPVASVFIMAASVISILVSISGLVGMRRKDPILVGLCACYWALMTIFFLVVSISILVLNKHLFGQNLQCAVVTGVWCGLLWLMYIYSIPMIIILLSVTSPLLYFHLRHALDLRRSPTQSTQVALANVQRGEDRSPTSDL